MNIAHPDNKVVVTASFSYKMNLGNYQTADFHCSQSAECSEYERDIAYSNMFQFCKERVREEVVRFKKEHRNFEEDRREY